MTSADGIGPGQRVRAWVAERAANTGRPVSISVLCETAMLRLGISGVTLTIELPAGWPETRHATDGLGARLAELQLTVGEGPCLDVWPEGGPILVPTLDEAAIQHRWPMFTPLAVEAGAGALFALPMAIGTIRVGVLALHRVRAGHLTAASVAESLAFAELALQLQLDQQAGPRTTEAAGLQLHAPQVHQATGMISAQLNVSLKEAFSRLRARAFADQRPLAELAADVVARRLRFDTEGGAS
jgi:ANTAR domain-containing protein